MLSSGSKNFVCFLLKILYPNQLNHLQVQENHLQQNNQNLMYPYQFQSIMIIIIKNILRKTNLLLEYEVLIMFLFSNIPN